MEDEIKISAIDDAVRILKGNFSGGMWIVLFVCSFSAIFLSIYLHYKKTGRVNPFSPVKFSWAYAIFDNLWRIAAGMLTMFFIFRLASAILSPAWVENNDMIILLGLGVGFAASFGIDRLIMRLMEKSNILKTPNPYDEVKKQILEPKPDQQ